MTTSMIHSKEETARIIREMGVKFRAEKRKTLADALNAVAVRISKRGWGPGEDDNLARQLMEAYRPTLDVYNLFRGAVAAYLNSVPEKEWIGDPAYTINLDAARDIIAWEEGQTQETVLDALREMAGLIRDFDTEHYENYDHVEIEYEDQDDEEGN